VPPLPSIRRARAKRPRTRSSSGCWVQSPHPVSQRAEPAEPPGPARQGPPRGASTATASWLRHLRETDQLRRAAADLWKVLPLFRYSRYDDSDPLEHDCRAAIYETVRKQPGAYPRRSATEPRCPLDGSPSRPRPRGRGAGDRTQGQRQAPLLPRDDDAELLAALAKAGKTRGARDDRRVRARAQRPARGRLERDPSTVSHHLAALEDDGLVVREKDGRSTVNELPPRVGRRWLTSRPPKPTRERFRPTTEFGRSRRAGLSSRPGHLRSESVVSKYSAACFAQPGLKGSVAGRTAVVGREIVGDGEFGPCSPHSTDGSSNRTRGRHGLVVRRFLVAAKTGIVALAAGNLNATTSRSVS